MSSNFNYENLERDLIKAFEVELAKVKETFSKLGAQISFSMELQKNYRSWNDFLCLTAHFIDNDWELHRWIIKYCGVFDEDQDHPCTAIDKALREYGIKAKLLTLTVGDEEALMADGFMEECLDMKTHSLKGQFFHVQCSADMISRMVQKGFKEIDEIITKVQCCSWSRSLPLWYLTTVKLSRALELYDAGEFASNSGDSSFFELPSVEEWEKVRKMCRIADKIYEIIKGLYDIKMPTANLNLPYLQEVRAFLVNQSTSTDGFVCVVAQKMLEVFNQYWDDMFLVLSIAAFLDPRYKMNFVELCLSDKLRTTTVKDTIHQLYKGYLVQCDQDYIMTDANSEEGERLKTLENLNVVKDYCQSMQSKKSDLDLYLEEPVFPWVENFSVLKWWKENQFKYPQLSRIARDFLAIPMSVVTSYDAYYIEPREADKSVLSLKPQLMNAIKCTKSWKFGSKK